MIFLGLFIMFFSLFGELFTNKGFFSPSVIMTTLFSVIVSLALLRKFGIQNFDNSAVLLVELGVICFVIGVSAIRLIMASLPVKTIPSRTIEFRWSFIYLITSVVTLIIFVSFFNAIKFLISGGSYVELRNALLGYGNTSVVISNPLVSSMSTYIAGPSLYALIPIAIFVAVKRNHLKFAILIFFDLFLNVLSSGSRVILLYTIIQFLVVVSFEKIVISKRMKKTVFIFIIVGVVGILVMSVVRSSNSLIRSFYTYFAAPIPLLSYWMHYVDQFNIHSYGLSFLYPFTWLFNASGGFIGIHSNLIQNVVQWQSLPQDIWVNVFPDQAMNAFSTTFYFFYEDFRYIGVLVFSFLFGMISEVVYFRAFTQYDEKYLVYYLLGIKALVGSFMIWQLGSTSFFLSFVILTLCIGKRKKSN